jgi:hypothetical protein
MKRVAIPRTEKYAAQPATSKAAKPSKNVNINIFMVIVQEFRGIPQENTLS